MRLSELPGADLVERGLSDLAHRRETVESLLVSVAAPRLIMLGLDVPSAWPDAETRLYHRLAEQHGVAAHSRYNALRRRIVSFQHALACAR